MRFVIPTVLAFILLVGNILASAQPAPAGRAERMQEQEQKKDDLPEGPGKKILLEACSECHEYKEVTKFAGYYKREEWGDLVKSMIVYGAMVTAEQEEILVDYLDTNFGKK